MKKKFSKRLSKVSAFIFASAVMILGVQSVVAHANAVDLPYV